MWRIGSLHQLVRRIDMNKAVCNYDKTQFFTLWGVYLSYLLMVPAIVGFFVSHLKSKQYQNCLESENVTQKNGISLLASHHGWLVRTFMFVVTFGMAGVGTMYLGVGYFIAAAAVLWWFFRVLRGMIALATNKAMPT